MEQPFRREAVAHASRIMVPVYPLHAAWFGFIYVVDPTGHVPHTPSLLLARQLGISMQLWGVLLLGMALVMTWAMIGSRRLTYVFLLYCYAAVMGWWIFIYLGSSLLTPEAPLAAVGWPFFGALSCHATATSLLRGDR